MIGLDTNVIIRYITQDDHGQSAQATQFIETELSDKEPGYITLITLVEVVWVLESCYQQSSDTIIAVIQQLLTTSQLVVEQTDVAYIALKRMSDGDKVDFSDALIAVISEKEGCQKVVTFDKKATKVGMTLLG